jgi:hypothetical protein
MNFTLIAYQEGNSYSDRCGDRYSHDGSHNIHFSTDEEEIATHWSEYLLKNQYLEEAEQEHQITLLQNGASLDDVEWGTDAYYEAEANQERIEAMAKAKIADRLAEKKRREEAEALAKRNREEAQRKAWAEQNEKSERAKYAELRAKFGDK